MYRRVDIYVPAALCRQLATDSLQSYPALYLIHGINGYEGAWQDRGNAIDTLEAQLARGACRPMLLIMPDCNKWPFLERPVTHGNAWKCVLHYRRLSREHEIEQAVSDLIDKIDSTYRISDCAIAGLSDGARISANVAIIRPDRVRTVGLFSPVLHKHQLPQDTTLNYAIYAGTRDIFYGYAKRFRRRLEREGYPYRWVELPERHTWEMWRQCLSHFLSEQMPANDEKQ